LEKWRNNAILLDHIYNSLVL